MPTILQRRKMEDKPFEKILNFRDVGKTINGFLGEKSHSLSSSHWRPRNLISTEPPLRLANPPPRTEHVNRAKKRERDLKNPALLQANDALAEPIEIPGMKYLMINVNGRGFERSMLWKLKFWSFMSVPPSPPLRARRKRRKRRKTPPPSSIERSSQEPALNLTTRSKLVTLMLLGYRMQAISILGREVMQPRGLIGLGHDSLDNSGPEIAEALLAFTNEAQTPILVHCTQGKDRTGLIVALLLLLLEIPLDAITHDYVRSEKELLPEREARVKEIESVGLSEDFAACPEDWVRCMHAYLNENYGGVRRYLRSVGVSEVQEESLVRGLRA
ncbi:tyrosine/serine protein phosphatase [Drepanopeziza brunnea f. sp. 'multigermtubi' MB_m1]|uniref:Tyrosine/serine protein phosphatase n=1 Tax=Marssonina brunnea f. sp. multigermtubi (strain MB_m1) TaxID=1072389 RepID=K1XNW2_MARBU|nr:tyrosine/serine protein phosphatase [Drepanopeziza brunnea f. sp. 'multigermtubi' MB_m1]EKD14134.1 tyrosine/serine protein phosphatase [Drepanopeziza brunnea f. sp. 'multigermtubi' MB_m1]